MSVWSILIAVGVVCLFAVPYARHVLSHDRKHEIRIGAGLFPDALPILLAIRRGYFSPLNVQLRFINWSKAPEYLVKDRYGAIFGPKRSYGEWLQQWPNIDVNSEVAFYMGFAVLVHPAMRKSVRSFKEILEASGSLTEKAAATRAFKQMQGYRVDCMSPDSKLALIRCLQEHDIDPKALTIRLTDEPNKAFSEFFKSFNVGGSDGGAAFFVGGVTQRLQAQNRELKVLISESEYAMGTFDPLAFISSSLFASEMATIQQGWYRAINEIYSSETARSDVVSYFNEYISTHIDPKISLTSDDLSLIFDEYEAFPRNERESLEMANQLASSGKVTRKVLIRDAKAGGTPNLLTFGKVRRG